MSCGRGVGSRCTTLAGYATATVSGYGITNCGYSDGRGRWQGAITTAKGRGGCDLVLQNQDLTNEHSGNLKDSKKGAKVLASRRWASAAMQRNGNGIPIMHDEGEGSESKFLRPPPLVMRQQHNEKQSMTTEWIDGKSSSSSR